MPTDFITLYVRPWDRLNHLLVHPYAFSQEASEPLREAMNIAIALRHLPEKSGVPQAEAHAECHATRIIRDVADSGKHGGVSKPTRSNSLSIASMFECDGSSGFRFVRNVINVAHVTHGEHDLVELEGAAIAYWRNKLAHHFDWEPKLREGPMNFVDKVVLFYNPEHQARLSGMTVRMVRRDANGSLVPQDTGFPLELRALPAIVR